MNTLKKENRPLDILKSMNDEKLILDTIYSKLVTTKWKEAFDTYEFAFDALVDLLGKNYNVGKDKDITLLSDPDSTGKKNILHTKVSVEAKRIINYIAYLCYGGQNNVNSKYSSQASVLDRIGLSHNMFTKWHMSPQKDFEFHKYKAPNPPLSYLGCKDGLLGYLVNYLSNQVNHSTFIDIFGGSGAASISKNISKAEGVKDIINDYDPIVVNYYRVLSDYNSSFITSLETVLNHINEVSDIIIDEENNGLPTIENSEGYFEYADIDNGYCITGIELFNERYSVRRATGKVNYDLNALEQSIFGNVFEYDQDAVPGIANVGSTKQIIVPAEEEFNAYDVIRCFGDKDVNYLAMLPSNVSKKYSQDYRILLYLEDFDEDAIVTTLDGKEIGIKNTIRTNIDNIILEIERKSEVNLIYVLGLHSEYEAKLKNFRELCRFDKAALTNMTQQESIDLAVAYHIVANLRVNGQTGKSGVTEINLNSLIKSTSSLQTKENIKAYGNRLAICKKMCRSAVCDIYDSKNRDITAQSDIILPSGDAIVKGTVIPDGVILDNGLLADDLINQDTTLAYCDSPYISTTGYPIGFGTSHFDSLVDQLNRFKGYWILSHRAFIKKRKASVPDDMSKHNQESVSCTKADKEKAAILSAKLGDFLKRFNVPNTERYILFLKDKDMTAEAYLVKAGKNNEEVEIMITNYNFTCPEIWLYFNYTEKLGIKPDSKAKKMEFAKMKYSHFITATKNLY